MKFLNYLSEKYFARSTRYEVFKNPSTKEMHLASSSGSYVEKFVRFIAVPESKTLYVSHSDFLHWLLVDFIKAQGETVDSNTCFAGTAKLKNKLSFWDTSIDVSVLQNVETKAELQKYKKMFAWTDRYFNPKDGITDWIEGMSAAYHR